MPERPPFDPALACSVSADVAIASRADAAALAARQARRLADLLTAAQRGSNLYRGILQGRVPAAVQLADLPIMRKPDLMRQFRDWVADAELKLEELRRFTADPSRIGEPFLGRYVVWESSGSSGEPCVFVQDASAMAVYDALEALRRPVFQPLRRLMDPWLLGERIVFVGALGGHFAATVSLQRLRQLNPGLASSLHSLSFLQPIALLVAQLQALQPTIISTYPSAAVLLVGERRAGRLDVSPCEVWTGGEDLSPAMRKAVEEGFGCPVANSYGASEFLSLASQCDHGNLHLNSDWAILEPVDESGVAVAPGTAGATTLLTNLANHLQPLIRYDLGDRVALGAAPCPCGSCLPVIEVQGRSDDTLAFRRADGGSVQILPLALSTVLEEEAGLFDFQLLQRGPCDLRLVTGMRGKAAAGALRRARAKLTAFLERHGAAGVQVHCRSGVTARPGRSGKIQRIVAKAS